MVLYKITIMFSSGLKKPQFKKKRRVVVKYASDSPADQKLVTRQLTSVEETHACTLLCSTYKLTAESRRARLQATQMCRTTALSVFPLACHPFTSNCISLTLSSCRLCIRQDLSWPGVDSNHQDRQQEKENKFFLHGRAVYSSV